MARLDLLTRMADMLDRERAAGRYKFDLSGWGYKQHCGTTACAMGIAVDTGEFKSEGLVPWDITSSYDKSYTPALMKNAGLLVGWDAIQKLFGISQKTAEYFFDQYSYTADEPGTIENVSARIRKYVAQHTPKTETVIETPVVERELEMA